MIVRMLGLLFGCHHRHITRPITPVRKRSSEPGNTYVACLECGRQFHYDTINMCIGTPMPMPLPSAPPQENLPSA